MMEPIDGLLWADAKKTNGYPPEQYTAQTSGQSVISIQETSPAKDKDRRQDASGGFINPHTLCWECLKEKRDAR
jgi:hypothetical protein